MEREEAINIVRNIYQTDEEKEALQTLIPELAESEDERNWKTIERAIRGFITNPIEADELLAWLEKQKHVESPNRDKVYSIMNKLTELSFSPLISFLSDEYKKIHEITSNVRDLLECPVKQMPENLVEWSEEDEKRLKQLYNIGTIRSDCKKRKTLVEHYKQISWLKSLRTQPKQETEEPLINRLNGLMQEYIKDAKDEAEEAHRLKCYHLFLDALEGQEFIEKEKVAEGFEIDALHSIIADPYNAGSEGCQLALRSLYGKLKEQLKK